MGRTRRSGDQTELSGAVTAILGWTHLLADERVELTREEVRTIAARIAAEASRLEAEWCGTSNLTVGGDGKTRVEAVDSARGALSGSAAPADVLGILCETVHDLGGWIELDHGQTGTALVIDLGVDSLPVVHAVAPPGSPQRQVIADEVGQLVEVARSIAMSLEREQLLRGLDLDQLGRDQLTGALDRSALDRLVHYIGPRHTVLAVRLVGLEALQERLGRAVVDVHVRRLAAMLSDQVRGNDYVFRVGADLFVVLALADRVGSAVLRQRLQNAWERTGPQAALRIAVTRAAGLGAAVVDAAVAATQD